MLSFAAFLENALQTYNPAMSNSPPSFWTARPILPLDRRNPYLALQHVTLFVRDQDRSLRFCVDCLGFNLFAAHRIPGGRWVAVAPPDGTAKLALVTPEPDSPEHPQIGQAKQIVFLTEDIYAKYEQWRERGVAFRHPPKAPAWGGMFTSFEDPDGNSFALIGFDEVSQEVEEQRRRAAEKRGAERRTGQELEIARQVQARLFPQRMPPAKTSNTQALACKLAKLAGTTMISLILAGRGLGLSWPT